MFDMTKVLKNKFEYTQDMKKLILEILEENEFKVAPAKNDDKYFIYTNLGKVCIRVRKYDDYKKYRDFTIRAKAEHDYKTEFDKIQSGFFKWFFYAGVNDNICEYVIIDVTKMLSEHLLENRNINNNNDGTGFICIPIEELRYCGCIFKEGKKEKVISPKQQLLFT